MKKLSPIIAIFAILIFTQCVDKTGINGYSGKYYVNDSLINTPQVIPGRLECEFYDQGGEGIAFHDSDSINSGSGRLNPADGTFLNEFRIKEAVDISYTKPNGVDDNPYNFVNPEMHQLYVGWTNPGEWLNYTVEVKHKGKYQIGLMFTSNMGGEIGLTVDKGTDTLKMEIPSTYVEADTVAWRQWHHWNYIENLGTIELKPGLHLLTLSTIKNGQMNYNYLDFDLVGKKIIKKVKKAEEGIQKPEEKSKKKDDKGHKKESKKKKSED
jgi:hypothetical protein